ncbi:HEPN domain-containing protein [Halosimplex pelagicum]|uniref:HEPN domain-containing protein n=1 Tax=Halosimplex pelagicum TaxID=869886 RepID=A0A7D5TXK0_9EURY|nr:HEPN domain-containing protein [Halosimplex pelagicum]QLH84834.1 HEPN domain-containing protein [Halosimplex pelagicum]
MADEEYVDEELGKAREALADAESLAAGSGSDAGVVNRLYYACFHAAQAALYDRGVDPSSHGAVRNLFGKQFVRDDSFSRAQGRLLTTLADLRQQADYGYEPIDEDVGALTERATAFVEAVERHLEGEPAG